MTVSPSVPQWAAVRKTVGEISVPEQYAMDPSTRAPTLGCLLPSGCPKVMASATPLHTSTVSSIMAAANRTDSFLLNTTSLFPLLV
jgi:hypothetical protein